MVRCGRRNSCPACAWLAAVENVSVVAIDAREQQPTVGMTLTTRRADFDMARYRAAVADVFRWLRREFGPDVAYLLLMEWTVGRSGEAAVQAKPLNGLVTDRSEVSDATSTDPQCCSVRAFRREPSEHRRHVQQESGTRTPSGSGRLPHGHLLVKGLPADVDLSPGCELWRELKARWEHHTGAWRVEMRELRTPGGAIAYMVGHHHKQEQAPPEGWSGKRFRPSQNYFVRPIAELRQEAKAERLRSIALLKLALERGDAVLELAGDMLDDLVVDFVNAPPPELVRVQEIPTDFDADGMPAAWELQVTGSVHE